MKHNLSKTGTCSSWQAMMTRCYNKNQGSFKRYGAVGIRVCEFLRASPVNLVLLIGYRPDGLSIDRPENKGMYSCGECAECLSNGWPLNVRWATRLQQNRNQNDLQYLTINGEVKCLSEWAEISGVSRGSIYNRIRAGITGESLIKPVRKTLCATINGETKTIIEWSKIVGVDQSTFRARIRMGWSDSMLLTPAIEEYKRR